MWRHISMQVDIFEDRKVRGRLRGLDPLIRPKKFILDSFISFSAQWSSFSAINSDFMSVNVTWNEALGWSMLLHTKITYWGWLQLYKLYFRNQKSSSLTTQLTQICDIIYRFYIQKKVALFLINISTQQTEPKTFLKSFRAMSVSFNNLLLHW